MYGRRTCEHVGKVRLDHSLGGLEPLGGGELDDGVQTHQLKDGRPLVILSTDKQQGLYMAAHISRGFGEPVGSVKIQTALCLLPVTHFLQQRNCKGEILKKQKMQA